jgi:hypothetical protein
MEKICGNISKRLPQIEILLQYLFSIATKGGPSGNGIKLWPYTQNIASNCHFVAIPMLYCHK